MAGVVMWRLRPHGDPLLSGGCSVWERHIQSHPRRRCCSRRRYVWSRSLDATANRLGLGIATLFAFVLREVLLIWAVDGFQSAPSLTRGKSLAAGSPPCLGVVGQMADHFAGSQTSSDWMLTKIWTGTLGTWQLHFTSLHPSPRPQLVFASNSKRYPLVSLLTHAMFRMLQILVRRHCGCYQS
ncbi:hypothetical protein B0T24DRAFT_304133 [Lasiosphaeria ovina]|uniref:Uncharacterized protein n=1 Tax=Lasiosphaeria ovina TaxID=92902 RepID=A0AAE0N5H1_9PEZI|nr:hypothetical protein B0T24DRAFT_304133 [Lasiosphaeria ovina]